jgi:hypothetical protein
MDLSFWGMSQPAVIFSKFRDDNHTDRAGWSDLAVEVQPESLAIRIIHEVSKRQVDTWCCLRIRLIVILLKSELG